MRRPFGITKILLYAFGALFPLQTFAVNAGITYHGRILKPDNSAEIDSAVVFKLQIRTPGSEDCLLYEETQLKDLSASNGAFSITLNDGTGTRTDTSGYSIDKIFGNRTSMTFSFPSTCAVGTTYTPNSVDGRKLSVSFKDSTMSSWEPLPAQTINFVPMAIEAYQVGGFPSTSLLRVENGSGPQTVSSLTPAQATALINLSNGSSTAYVQAGANGASLPSFSTDPSSPTAGQVWYDSTNKIVKYYDGTTVQAVGSGTITGSSITSGTIGGSTSMNTSGSVTAASVSSTTDSTNALRLFENTNTHKVTLTVPSSLAADYPLQLPGALPTATNQFLVSNTSGVMTWSPSMAIDASGNLGVGTTAPKAKLEVVGDVNFGIGSTYPMAAALSSNSDKRVAIGYGSNIDAGIIDSQELGQGAKPLVINPNGGKVGVGTTNPSGTFDVEGGTALSGNGTDISLIAQNGAAAGNNAGGNVNITSGNRAGSGTWGNVNINAPGFINLTGMTNLTTGSGAGSYTGASTSLNRPTGVLNAGENSNSQSTFFTLRARNSTATDQYTYFGTVPVDGVTTPMFVIGAQTGATAFNERLRIDQNGNVAIGTTTAAGNLTVDNTGHNATLCLNGGCVSTLAAGYSSQTSTSNFNLNSNSDATGTDGGFNFQANGTNLLTIANNGDTTITSTSATTSQTNGALVVSGGIGVAKGVITGGGINNWANGASTIYTPTSASAYLPGATAVNINTSNTGPADGTIATYTFGAKNTATTSQNAYMGVVSNSSGYTPNIVWGQQTGATAYSERMRMDAYGNLGIGTTSPIAPLDVRTSSAVTSGSASTNYLYMYANPSSASTGSFAGFNSVAEYASNTSSTNLTGLNGSYAKAFNSGTGTIKAASGAQGEVSGNAGTITNAYGGVFFANTNGGTITNGGGLYVSSTVNTGAITNAYGIYIGGIQGTNKWALYSQDSTVPSYFAGKVGIGSTAPVANLDVAGGQIDINGVNGISFPTTDSTANASVAIGAQALNKQSTLAAAAYNNVAIGYQAAGGASMTSASINNTVIGYQAFKLNTSGAQNTIIGASAANNLTSGSTNTAVGVGALSSYQGGNNNIGIGAYSTGGSWTGSYASGSQNIGIGGSTLTRLTSGSSNTAIGYNVGNTTLMTGSNNILLGTSSAVDTPLASTSNYLNIGNLIYGTSIGTAATPGNVGIGTNAPIAKLDVTPTVTANTDLKTTNTGLIYNGGSTMTNYYANYVTAPSGSGTITNKYALVTEAAAGNVGIATTSPSLKLDVGGSAIFRGPTVGGIDGELYYNTATHAYSYYNAGTASWQSLAGGTVTYSGSTWGLNGSDTYYTAGQVGINTSSPAARLEVAQTSNASNGGIAVSNAANTRSLLMWVDSSNNSRIDSSSAGTAPLILNTNGGKVGIGTTSPVTTLDVAGGISINGYNAVNVPTSDPQSVAVGNQALASLSSTPAAYTNTAVGYQALTATTTGTQNVAVGWNALLSNTTGGGNIAMGYQALRNNTTGSSNLAIGSYQTLLLNTTGQNNHAVGSYALYTNSTGNNNVAFGQYALYGGTYSGNVAMGQAALRNLNTGGNNVAIGYQAGYGTAGSTTAASSVFLGYQAGFDITSGSNNIIIGPYTTTGVGVTSGSNNLLIGQDVRPPSQTASNQMNIGNLIYATGLASGSTASTGNVGIGTTSPGATLDVKGHVANSGAAATIGTCGTSPSLSGNDTRGTVTLGSGGVTSCAITFASAFSSAPTCIITWKGASAQTAVITANPTTTGLTALFSSSVASGSFSYICMQ